MPRRGSRAPRTSSLVPLEEPWLSLRETYLGLVREVEHLLTRFDLSFSEYVALEETADEAARASGIAEAIGMTSAGVTDLIDRLERRRLVRRRTDPRDRRAVLVELTSGGKRLFRDARLAQLEMLHRLGRAMTDRERDALLAGLTALGRALKREGA